MLLGTDMLSAESKSCHHALPSDPALPKVQAGLARIQNTLVRLAPNAGVYLSRTGVQMR